MRIEEIYLIHYANQFCRFLEYLDWSQFAENSSPSEKVVPIFLRVEPVPAVLREDLTGLFLSTVLKAAVSKVKPNLFSKLLLIKPSSKLKLFWDFKFDICL